MSSPLKKPYQTPEFIAHGSVEKITEQTAKKTPGSADGQGSRILNG